MLECLITPAFGKTISGISVKRIDAPTVLSLNLKEVIRCMSGGTVDFVRPDGTYKRCNNPEADYAAEIVYRQKLLQENPMMVSNPVPVVAEEPAPVAEPVEEVKEDEVPVVDEPNVLTDSSMNPKEKEDYRRDLNRKVRHGKK